VPVALLGNPEKVRFVIVSTMPGAASYKISTVCDVLPGGKKSIDSQLLTAYNEYYVQMAPGTTKTTVTAEGFLYDNDGNLMADLDGSGEVVKRYIYAPGGKHLAMQIPSTQNWTYEDNRLSKMAEAAVVSDAQAVDQLAIKATKGSIPLYNCVSYGPYTADQCNGGRYLVRFRVKIGNIASAELGQEVMRLDAAHGSQGTVLNDRRSVGRGVPGVDLRQERCVC